MFGHHPQGAQQGRRRHRPPDPGWTCPPTPDTNPTACASFEVEPKLPSWSASLYRRPVAADSANGGEGVTATMDAIALLAVGALGLVAGRIARAVVPWPGALGVVGTAARRGGGEQHRLHAAGRLHRVNAGVVVVQAGDAILVRSIRGRRGGWYRRLGPTPTARPATEPTSTPCVPARSRTPPPWRRSPVPMRPRTATAPRWAAADRGGGRRDAGAGAPTVAIVVAGRRAPDPGPHQAGQGRPDPGRRPPLHRPHPTAPARTRTSSLRAIRRRRQCSATGSRAGVRARNSATNSPPRRARSSLGWDHAAAATVRHCEGCSEARVQHHSLRPGASNQR
jgi:hypothetical protein